MEKTENASAKINEEILEEQNPPYVEAEYDSEKLAKIVFKGKDLDFDELMATKLVRQLPENAEVTRFGPSPTGFVHLGNIYTSLIGKHLANQTNGIFYLRIEDTDKLREVPQGSEKIVKVLKDYNINFDEGYGIGGPCSPYKQSERTNIYQTVVKHLMEKGYAYPCFCDEEMLTRIHNAQEIKKLNYGYYGHYALCRQLNLEQINRKIKAGKPFVVRLRSKGNPENKIVLHDLIRGDLHLQENFQDIVLLKSDGTPTYHLAHVVDDYLMGTTTVTRGEEWIPSYPIHHQLFEYLGWPEPKYAHIAPLMKKDGDSRRKLSKRKDPELSASYYEEQGYSHDTVIEYCYTIINSNYESWRSENPTADISEFTMSFKKMSDTGPLFDIAKVEDIGKNVIANKTDLVVVSEILNWTSNYDLDFNKLINEDVVKFLNSLKIWRYNNGKIRKDIAKWSDLKPMFPYLYDTKYDKLIFDFGENATNYQLIYDFLSAYLEKHDFNIACADWFNEVKEIATPFNFATNMKDYKLNPNNYVGSIADACNYIRIAITGTSNTPDLCSIMEYLGKDTVTNRMEKCKNYLLKMINPVSITDEQKEALKLFSMGKLTDDKTDGGIEE